MNNSALGNGPPVQPRSVSLRSVPRGIFVFCDRGTLTGSFYTPAIYSLADRHYLRFLLDNEYMDRRNITCLISFIINVTKQNLFATMRGSVRNVYSTPIQDKPNFPFK